MPSKKIFSVIAYNNTQIDKTLLSFNLNHTSISNEFFKIRCFHTDRNGSSITPKLSFENADRQKLEIFDEIRGKAGVYR